MYLQSLKVILGTVKGVIDNNVNHQSIKSTIMRVLSKIINTSNSLDDDLESIRA